MGKLGLRMGRTALGRAAFPYKLNFAVTGRCNCRCRACRIWATESQDLSLQEIRSFLRRSNRFSWIDLTGGEIFLREDIGEIFSEILATGRSLALLHFPTNGTMPESVERCVRLVSRAERVLPVVTVSLDGPREYHDASRGFPGAFDAACETYQRLKGISGCRVYFGLTLCEENLGLFEATLAEVSKRLPGVGLADFHFNLPHQSDHYYRNSPEEAQAFRKTAKSYEALVSRSPTGKGGLALFERRYSEGVPIYGATGKPPFACAALSATCFVRNDGEVYPCTIWDRSLGNLKEFDFDLASLWRTERSALAYREAQAQRCPGCWTPCEAFPAIARRLALPFRSPLPGP